MKKHLILIIILLILIFPVRNARGSELSKIIDQVTGFTLCNIPLITTIPGMSDNCAQTNPEHLDLVTVATGRLLIRTGFGCGNNFYERNENKETGDITGKNLDKRVVLLGDSLTMFGGFDEVWNAYLGGGIYKVMNKGAAGATSSAWKEHFEICINAKEPKDDPWASPPWNLGVPAGGYGRPQLPPRTIMMIGGNDFHVYKGMLQAMWWAVPLRRLNVVHNIEKLITYHHQGNNGCGDYRRVKNDAGEVTGIDPVSPDNEGKCPDNYKDDKIDYKDWGLGRLFVLLGNIPAISLDTTLVPGFDNLLRSLGLYNRPNDDIASNDNIKQADLHGDALTASLFEGYYEAYIEGLLAMYTLNMIAEQQNCGNLFGNCKDHTWASRQMYKLQFTSGAMSIVRGGVPYIHMYSFFRDNPANNRGCWWCADRGLWMGDKENYNHIFWSSNDGIHVNHINGYLRWGSIVTPFMSKYKMDEEDRRNDGVDAPGGEVTIPQGCDDLCLYVLCVMTGYCKN
ncbi:MAG: hypothetical protein H7A23_07240 [Leptospiraceae bacterium]|nr:hypothetical protein [Leptospiraceae bacterium]MCP5494334.1 hypothetical protein [Leptospiraceae bacterium]